MLGLQRVLLLAMVLLAPLFSAAEVIDGNQNGDVTLVEYYDYQCSHCRHMADVIDLLIDKNPDLKVVYRVTPVLGKNSWYAARASLAARTQGKYEAFHDGLVAQRGRITKQVVNKVAKRVGLDMRRLKKDMYSDFVSMEIKGHLSQSSELGVRSIPTIFLKRSTAQGAGRRFNGTVSFAHLQEALTEKRS